MKLPALTLSHRARLSETVFRVTTLCPRIVHAMVKAAHGPDEARMGHLRQAEEMCETLAGLITRAKLRVKLENEASEAADA